MLRKIDKFVTWNWSEMKFNWRDQHLHHQALEMKPVYTTECKTSRLSCIAQPNPSFSA